MNRKMKLICFFSICWNFDSCLSDYLSSTSDTSSVIWELSSDRGRLMFVISNHLSNINVSHLNSSQHSDLWLNNERTPPSFQWYRTYNQSMLNGVTDLERRKSIISRRRNSLLLATVEWPRDNKNWWFLDRSTDSSITIE